MLLLTSTSDIIRVVTGTTGSSICVHASWVDNLNGVITPGRTNTTPITTNTTTTVVASPASSTQRNVKGLYLTNNHATVSTTIVVQHFDGTTSEDLISITLMPGEELFLNAEGTWQHLDATGAPYAYSGPANPNLGITGTLAETMPRETCPEINTAHAGTGVLYLQAIYLKAGMLISNISFFTATTAAGTPTNYFFALYSGTSRALLAVSANQTTSAWAANALKTLPMVTPYRVPVSGVYYLGIMMTATTMITLKGGTARTGAQLGGTAPILTGLSNSGLTTSMPDPANTPANQTTSIWGAVS